MKKGEPLRDDLWTIWRHYRTATVLSCLLTATAGFVGGAWMFLG